MNCQCEETKEYTLTPEEVEKFYFQKSREDILSKEVSAEEISKLDMPVEKMIAYVKTINAELADVFLESSKLLIELSNKYNCKYFKVTNDKLYPTSEEDTCSCKRL